MDWGRWLNFHATSVTVLLMLSAQREGECARELRPSAEVVRIQAHAVARTQFAVRYASIADEEREIINRFVDNGRRLGLRRP